MKNMKLEIKGPALVLVWMIQLILAILACFGAIPTWIAFLPFFLYSAFLVVAIIVLYISNR